MNSKDAETPITSFTLSKLIAINFSRENKLYSSRHCYMLYVYGQRAWAVAYLPYGFTRAYLLNKLIVPRFPHINTIRIGAYRMYIFEAL